jgi:phosphoenolpyruvate carboxylase
VDRARGLHGADVVDTGLDALSLDDTLSFVRGFMLFSMLANLAEDRQGVAAEPGADVASAVAKLESHGIEREAVLDLLSHALIVPVLTAHPTEVRRKSMIDHKNRIADLMALKDAGRTETDEGENLDEAIFRQIALLWQTRPLRREKLFVADEIENVLAYFRDVFLPVLPALYARWERVLGARPQSFLRVGNWIGGDRDGNPFVQAPQLRLALVKGCEAALGFYMDALHALGAELSLSTELAHVSQAVLDLADVSGDMSPSRQDEPYRRALSGIYARLAATHWSLVGKAPARPSTLKGEPYASPSDLRRDLVTVAQGLASEGNGALATGGALGRLIRALETFGFHLATPASRCSGGNWRTTGRSVRPFSNIRKGPRPNSPSFRPRRRRTASTARNASPTISSPRRRAFPTCSKSTSSSRKRASGARGPMVPRRRRRSWPFPCSKPSLTWRPRPRSWAPISACPKSPAWSGRGVIRK